MKWLIAPTAFKDCLTAKEASRIIAQALDRLNISYILCPVADGGNDTVECLVDGTHGNYNSIINYFGMPRRN